MSTVNNPQEMESKYASLKRARDSGSITDAQFQSDVAQLRLQAPDGSWYQIDPGYGHWLKWNGQIWEKTGPPAIQQQMPRKFFPLLLLILKSTFQAFLKQLPMMIIFGVIGWLLHTFLLVVINEGFGEGTFIGNFLATQNNTLSGTIIWMVASSFIFGWIGRKITQKGGKTPKKPSPSLHVYFREAGKLATVSILAAAGLSLIIGLAANSYANLALAVGFGGLMLSNGGSVVALLFCSAWSSTYSLAQPKQHMEFSAATGHMAMVGSVIGFVASSFMPPLGKIVFGIGALVAAFLLIRRQGQSPTAVLLFILPPILLLGAIIYLLKAIPVLADDGGWAESGGTFPGWIGSEGAAQAVTMGIGPATGTMVGPALGQALTNIGSDIPIVDGGEDVTQAPPSEETPEPETAALQGPQPSTDPDDPPGTTVQHNADGTVTIRLPDGTVGTQYTDGTQYWEGTHGDTLTYYPDGTTKEYDPETGLKVEHPNGEMEITLPDGRTSSLTINPDGSSDAKSAYGGNMHFPKDGPPEGSLTSADGNTFTLNKDGTGSINTPGGTLTMDKDGNFSGTMSDKEGNKITVKPDGSFEGETAEGDKITVDADGMRAKFKDGSFINTDANGTPTSAHLTDKDGTIDINTDDKGGLHIKDDKGNTADVNKDGSGQMKDSEGNVATQDSEGNADITNKEGTTWSTKSDGTGSIFDKKGNRLDLHKDGSITVKESSGKTTTYTADQIGQMKAQGGGGNQADGVPNSSAGGN